MYSIFRKNKQEISHFQVGFASVRSVSSHEIILGASPENACTYKLKLIFIWTFLNMDMCWNSGPRNSEMIYFMSSFSCYSSTTRWVGWTVQRNSRWVGFEFYYSLYGEKLYLQEAMYYFVYYINTLMTTIMGDFPKIPEHRPKISKDFLKVVWRPDKRFRTFSKNFRGLPKISEEDLMMFWSCGNTSIKHF